MGGCASAPAPSPKGPASGSASKGGGGSRGGSERGGAGEGEGGQRTIAVVRSQAGAGGTPGTPGTPKSGLNSRKGSFSIRSPRVLENKNEEDGLPFGSNNSNRSLRSEASNAEEMVAFDANVGLQVYSIKLLSKATKLFLEPDMVLGAGSFGKVYKGWVKDSKRGPDPIPIAVKRLHADGMQGMQEWLAEVTVLGRLQHPNLVRLMGYCNEKEEKLLVYEFMPLGSLDYHLFSDGDSTPPLSWKTRVKIALDSAMGLAFLHENDVIHRDFKAQNVLLDKDYSAKLTDFGFAKVASKDKSYVSTQVLGTMGYLDPSYMETGYLRKVSDVYSFGVLMLELLTGRKAVDPDNDLAPTLVASVSEVLKKPRLDILPLLDPLIHAEFSSREMQREAKKFAISAKHCIQEDPSLRPTMNDMVLNLRPLLESGEDG